ncbi:MAG: amidohydrolase family protein, partial [SAR86 cluster bacterium]
MDIVIRNGSIVDGSGRPAYIGDIGISAGRIHQVGHVSAQGATEIDATGKTVSPGFIDPHTHFDAQLLWDGAAKPAIEHGVTTIVPGNCSLSLAPLKAADRMKLVGMFNQIEAGAQDAPLLNPSFPSYNFDVMDGVSYQINLSQPSKFDKDGGEVNPDASR